MLSWHRLAGGGVNIEHPAHSSLGLASWQEERGTIRFMSCRITGCGTGRISYTVLYALAAFTCSLSADAPCLRQEKRVIIIIIVIIIVC